MISEAVTSACLEDVNFIDSEIKRHFEARRTVADFWAFYEKGIKGAADAMATLKHEVSGQERPCGKAALSRFSSISQRLVASFENASAWNSAVLADRFRLTFLRFLTVGTYPQLNEAIRAWLEDGVRHVELRHRSLTHYVPCIALNLGDRETYAFGPISFVKKNIFFANNAASIDSYEGAHERLNERARRNASPGLQHCWERADGRKKTRAVDSFKGFTDGMDWIAIVPVPRCEHFISAERAEAALRVAISAIKLLLPGDEGADLRVADDPRPSMRKHRLSSVNGRMFRATGKIRFGSPRVPEEWEAISRRTPSQYLRFVMN
jgi:hypothetical protein